jgi:hypothetical protein
MSFWPKGRIPKFNIVDKIEVTRFPLLNPERFETHTARWVLSV